jgi:hypothetical protein
MGEGNDMKIIIQNYSGHPSTILIDDDEVIRLFKKIFVMGSEACFFRHYGYRLAERERCPECGEVLKGETE